MPSCYRVGFQYAFAGDADIYSITSVKDQSDLLLKLFLMICHLTVWVGLFSVLSSESNLETYNLDVFPDHWSPSLTQFLGGIPKRLYQGLSNS